MRFLLKIIALAKRISSLFVWLAVAAIVAVVLAITAEITFRALAGRSLHGVIEMSALLMAVIAYLAIAGAQSDKQHIRVTFLTERFSQRTQLALEMMILVLTLGLITMGLWRTGVAWYASWTIKEFSVGFIKFPIWPAKIFPVLGLGALAIQLLADILEQMFIKIPGKGGK